MTIVHLFYVGDSDRRMNFHLLADESDGLVCHPLNI